MFKLSLIKVFLLGFVGLLALGRELSALPLAPNECSYTLAATTSCDIDSDGDLVMDCDDLCPDDQYNIEPGECGCGLLGTDFNFDGLLECYEPCDFDPALPSGGLCDCPLGKAIQAFIGVSFDCGRAPTLNRGTVITEPPGVIVQRELDGTGTVTLVFERFSGALNTFSRAKVRQPEELPLTNSALPAKNARLKVRYEAQITNKESSDIIRRVTKKVQLTLKGLPPGSYTARYRAQGIENEKVVFKSKFSPSQDFSF